MTIDLANMSPEDKQALYDALAYDMRGQAVQVDERMQTLWDDIGDALQLPRRGRQPLKSFLETPGNRPKMQQVAAAVLPTLADPPMLPARP